MKDLGIFSFEKQEWNVIFQVFNIIIQQLEKSTMKIGLKETLSCISVIHKDKSVAKKN
jgi:hypothetical protein